ncbi:MAG: hypothetical protein Q9208_001527 [Pyrenodesmia sp. 3 TL-2023]
MDRWQTYTTTTLTKSLVLVGNKLNPSYTFPTPPVREVIDPLPAPTSVVASVPTEALTVINFFDGVQPLSVTKTLPLTTAAPTILTTSGRTTTLPGRTIVRPETGGPHVYPHDGCWDDPDCWWSHTHSLAMPTVTSAPGVVGQGYNTENPQSAKKFFAHAGPYIGLGIGIASLMILFIWLAARYRAMKQKKRKNDAEERQSKRMGEGEGKEEVGAESGDAAGEGIQLETMRADRQEPRQERGFGERSETWATHATTASSDAWFVTRRSTTDDFV